MPNHITNKPMDSDNSKQENTFKRCPKMNKYSYGTQQCSTASKMTMLTKFHSSYAVGLQARETSQVD